MLFGNLYNFVNVARVAKKMHQNNGAGAIGDVCLNRFRGHIQRLGVYIGKDRHGILHENRHNAAGIGDRGGDDFIAGVGIDDTDRRVDGSGPARRRLCVLCAVKRSEFLF